MNATKLSEYIWELKQKHETYKIKWSILNKGKMYVPGSKQCNLCDQEKYHIIMNPQMASLNKQDELLKICIHKKWLFLKI